MRRSDFSKKNSRRISSKATRLAASKFILYFSNRFSSVFYFTNLQRLLQNTFSILQAAERAKTGSALHQDETKRQAIMYEKSIKKLYQEVEIAKADEAQRQRSILKVHFRNVKFNI